MDNNKDVLNISIPADDLIWLITEALGLEVEEGSFLFGRKKGNEVKTEGDRSEQYGGLIQDQTFLKVARSIAAPDYIVACRNGGGSLGLEEIRLHARKQEGAWIAAVSETTEGSCDIRVFESTNHFLDWWTDLFCGKNEEPAVNSIPPFVKLEEFLFLLHAVDSYRAVSYRNMLEHRYSSQPSMEFTEFVNSMTESIKSKDIRWLLPAFLVLTPGLSEYPMELTPEKAEILMKLQFAGNLEQPEGGRSRLIFGEAGKNMGVEFYRSWLMAAGFEISVKDKGIFKATERLFVAPTALSNHFVSVLKDEEGKAIVNHQAYTFEELKVKLEALFDRASALAGTEESVGAVPAAETVSKAGGRARFCASCGAPLEPAGAFCSSCGAKV